MISILLNAQWRSSQCTERLLQYGSSDTLISVMAFAHHAEQTVPRRKEHSVRGIVKRSHCPEAAFDLVGLKFFRPNETIAGLWDV